MEYDSYDTGISIYFKCPELDLREIGLVTTTIHRLVNKVAAKQLELYELSDFTGRQYDPLTVSLQVTTLTFDSISAETKLKIKKGAGTLAMNVVGSLIATVIISIASCAPHSTQVETTTQKMPVTPVNVGPNINYMVMRLAATNKPWELTVTDTATGHSVTIRSMR